MDFLELFDDEKEETLNSSYEIAPLENKQAPLTDALKTEDIAKVEAPLFSIDKSKSLKQNLLDFSGVKKDKEDEIGRLRSTEKAIALGDALSLVGKGVSAWGGIMPKYDPRYFKSTQAQRAENERMYDALGMEERNLKLGDYYRDQQRKDAEDAAAKNRQALIEKAKYDNQAALAEINYKADKDEKDRQAEIYLKGMGLEAQAREGDANRKAANSRLYASLSAKAQGAGAGRNSAEEKLLLQDDYTGEIIEVPEGIRQDLMKQALESQFYTQKRWATDKSRFTDKEMKEMLDAEVRALYQDILNKARGIETTEAPQVGKEVKPYLSQGYGDLYNYSMRNESPVNINQYQNNIADKIENF